MAFDGLRVRLAALFSFLFWIRLKWHVFYQRFNQTYFLVAPAKVSATSRRIISIGDGFARCVGDTAVIGSRVGLANRINDLLDRNKTGDSTLHMHWECIDRGEYGYTSDDWLPRAGSVFEKLFAEDDGDGVEADVVLLTVGSEDCRAVRHSQPTDMKAYAAKVVGNITIIASDLAALDKIVFIAGVRCGAAQDSGRSDIGAAQMEINHQLKKAVKELNEYYPGRVHLGPTNESRLFSEKRCYCFDRHHFSNHGHTLSARNWVRALAPVLQAFEYDYVKTNHPEAIKRASLLAQAKTQPAVCESVPTAVSNPTKKSE